MWIQFGSSEVCNGGRFGGLSLDYCAGQILEFRTDNSNGVGMILDLIFE